MCFIYCAQTKYQATESGLFIDEKFEISAVMYFISIQQRLPVIIYFPPGGQCIFKKFV
jgi:hypothetical protein